jgi:Domain of unknown function (DUF5668)
MSARNARPGCGSGLPITPQLVFGLIIIFIGLVFTLDRLGIAPAASYLRYWPTALIAVGLLKVLSAREGGGAFVGVVIMLAGAWLQAETLGIIVIRLQDVWPLALLVLGGYLVWTGLSARQAPPPRPAERDPFAPLPPLESFTTGLGVDVEPGRPAAPPPGPEVTDGPAAPPRGGSSTGAEPGRSRTGDHDSTINAVAILGAVTRGHNTRLFKGANLVAFMGGLEIDLRHAEIHGEAIIDMFAMWGGIEIRVPDNWVVSSQIVPVMGGVEDKTRPPRGGPGGHRLILRGVAFMGGIEIKN